MKAMRVAADNDLRHNVVVLPGPVARGRSHERGDSFRKGSVLKGIPRVCEDIGTMRDIAVAEYTGCRLHICHVSTRGSIEAIRRAKASGRRSYYRRDLSAPSRALARRYRKIRRDGEDQPAAQDERRRESPSLMADSDGTLDCLFRRTTRRTRTRRRAWRARRFAESGIIGLQTSFIWCLIRRLFMASTSTCRS